MPCLIQQMLAIECDLGKRLVTMKHLFILCLFHVVECCCYSAGFVSLLSNAYYVDFCRSVDFAYFLLFT